MHRTILSSRAIENTSPPCRVCIQISLYIQLIYLCFCNYSLIVKLCFLRYTHIEAECPFITFDDLLDRLEDLICDVVERVLQSPLGHLVQELNPGFQMPKRPFKRMNYSDAIEYLRENNITKEDGSFYEFGEVGISSHTSYISRFLPKTRPVIS